MMTAFKERIKRFEDLEVKASPGPWEYESQESGFSEEIIGYMTKPDLEDMLNGKDCDVALSVAFRNDGLPLLKEMQAEIDRLRKGINLAFLEIEAGKPGDAESILDALL